MKKFSASACGQLLLCLGLYAQTAQQPAAKAPRPEAPAELKEESSRSAAKLPVRRVVLYKNGVA